MPPPGVVSQLAPGSTGPAAANTGLFGGVLDFLSGTGEAISVGLDSVSNIYASVANFDGRVKYVEDQKSGVGTYQPVSTPAAASATSGNLPVYLLLGLAVVAGVVILKD